KPPSDSLSLCRIAGRSRLHRVFFGWLHLAGNEPLGPFLVGPVLPKLALDFLARARKLGFGSLSFFPSPKAWSNLLRGLHRAPTDPRTHVGRVVSSRPERWKRT